MILNKESKINIVLPKNSTALENFAAEELAKYLKGILEANAEFSKETVLDAYNFIIGNPERNDFASNIIKEDEFKNSVCGKEGFLVKQNGNNILFAGSNDDDGYDRGTLYSVYEFLEIYCGCCFGAYSKADVDAGEIVPKADSLNLENVYILKAKADLPYRTAIVQFDCWAGDADHPLTVPFFDWLAKNRYNRILTWVSCYEQLKDLNYIPELEKRGIRLSVGHHQATFTWLPPYGNKHFPTKYYEEHPEYFRLLEDGTRYKPKDDKDFLGQIIVCTRNEELIEEVSKNVIEWAKKNPLVDVIAFWPNDFMAPCCCCEECSKYSKIENYLYFENELAKRISKELPDVKVDVLIYTDLWECPENIKLCDNIIIDESTWAEDGIRHCGKPDGSCLIGQKAEKNLLNYRKICENTVFYEYYMGNYENWQRVMPACDELQSLYKHYMECGISGSGTQMECFNLWNNLFNFYGFARTAYDTELSLENLIEKISVLFGKGGEFIKEIFRIYEETLDGQVKIFHTGDFFAEHINRYEIYDLFDKALNSAETARERNNIRMLRMAFRYTILGSLRWPDDSETEELDYIYTNFNSFLTKGGYGIAIPKRDTRKLTEKTLADKWYEFE